MVALAVCVGLLRAAEAQTRLGTVEVEAARDVDPAVDSPGFVSIVDATHPTARTSSVADLLEAEAGVRVRSRGGLGTFTSVSIRGSDDAEVAVLVDGVPLPRSASGRIDLSQLPADGLERIEVYRGVPPVELGAEAIGGAINLITRRAHGRSIRASAGGGSFGARELSAGATLREGALGIALSAAYRGATGDFSYYDIAGTLLTQADDHITVRRNNDFDQGAIDLVLDGKSGRLRARAGVHAFYKGQGVPGIASLGVETRHARLTTGRLFVDGEVRRSGRRVDLTASAHFLYERIAFANPSGEQVGPFGASVTEGETLAGGLRGRVDVPWGRRQLWSGLAEVRAETRRPYDLLSPDALRSSSRVFLAAALVDEVRLFGDRFALTPAVRVDVAVSQLAAGAAPTQLTTDVFPSPRLGVRAEVNRTLTLRASAGRFVRFPTLVELFGDGGFLLPRADLRPESAWGGDAGASARAKVRTSGVELAGWLEGAFFGRRVTDAIAFVGSGRGSTAFNVGDAELLGCELRLGVAIADRYRLRLDYTFLHTSGTSSEPGTTGKALPGRAPHQLAFRAEWLRAPFRVFYQLDFVDQVFRDPQNYVVLPGYTLHALGLELADGPWQLIAEARNLADLRLVDLPLGGSAQAGRTVPYPVADFYNYPLPGRAVYVTVAFHH